MAHTNSKDFAIIALMAAIVIALTAAYVGSFVVHLIGCLTVFRGIDCDYVYSSFN